jgi:hypothetical protein
MRKTAFRAEGMSFFGWYFEIGAFVSFLRLAAIAL